MPHLSEFLGSRGVKRLRRNALYKVGHALTTLVTTSPVQSYSSQLEATPRPLPYLILERDVPPSSVRTSSRCRPFLITYMVGTEFLTNINRADTFTLWYATRLKLSPS